MEPDDIETSKNKASLFIAVSDLYWQSQGYSFLKSAAKKIVQTLPATFAGGEAGKL